MTVWYGNFNRNIIFNSSEKFVKVGIDYNKFCFYTVLLHTVKKLHIQCSFSDIL
jgi:hypothetical protein